jgi:hypothetical protein
VTKPACTALVNSDALKSSIATLWRRLGTIAVAENHNESASICAPHKAAKDDHFPFSMLSPVSPQ